MSFSFVYCDDTREQIRKIPAGTVGATTRSGPKRVRGLAANQPPIKGFAQLFLHRPGREAIEQGGSRRGFSEGACPGRHTAAGWSKLPPRMHDLRHSFAVHRMLEWYRQGANVQNLLPHLSVYLGHRRLCHTQVYLSMIPELLDQAGGRFESYAWKEKCYE